MHAAGITLMRGDPRLVPAALEIGRRTYAKIRQNLFWAFVYNLIGLPLAAFGLLDPMLARAAMALSSVSGGRQRPAAQALAPVVRRRCRAMNIGQAARRSGLSAKMLRHYEQIGRAGARRRAAPTATGIAAQTDLQRLTFIRRARDLGFSLEELGRLLALWDDRERASADVKALALQHIDALERRIAELAGLRDSLRELVEHCQGDARPDCPILHGLAGPPRA